MFCVCASPTANAQTGCTDPQATNFNPAAALNDGSCIYPKTDYSLEFITNLPSEIDETSALQLVQNQLFTLNDSGNSSELFVFDSVAGDLKKKIFLAGAPNVDWEELAASATHLYVGDFGNNLGDRRDLRIYKIVKSDLEKDTVTGEVIEFTWPDQTDFTPRNRAHNFDCEAFFFFKDSLWLFSKNWENAKTKLYVLPAAPGSYVAQLRDSFDAQGMITAVDLDSEGTVGLLGYTTLGQVFSWLLFDYPETHFLKGNKRRIELGSSLQVGQAEGLVFSQKGRGFISSEKFVFQPAQLFRFQTDQWTDKISSTKGVHLTTSYLVFPNPFEHAFFIEKEESPRQSVSIKLTDVQGNTVLKRTLGFESLYEIRLPKNLAKGAYFLTIISGNSSVTKRLQRQ